MWRLSRTQKLLRCKLLCSSSLLLHRKGDKDHCSYWDYKKKQTKLKVSAGINDFRSTRACFYFPLIQIKGASSLTGMMYSLFWGVVGWSWRKTLELFFSILHSFYDIKLISIWDTLLLKVQARCQELASHDHWKKECWSW